MCDFTYKANIDGYKAGNEVKNNIKIENIDRLNTVKMTEDNKINKSLIAVLKEIIKDCYYKYQGKETIALIDTFDEWKFHSGSSGSYINVDIFDNDNMNIGNMHKNSDEFRLMCVHT